MTDADPRSKPPDYRKRGLGARTKPKKHSPKSEKQAGKEYWCRATPRMLNAAEIIAEAAEKLRLRQVQSAIPTLDRTFEPVQATEVPLDKWQM